VAVAAVGLFVTVAQRPAAALAEPPAAADDAHAGHAMSALEHLKMLAADGNIHAAHGLEQLKWQALQAAPINTSLPPDDAGAAARLASSPRKGEYVTIDVNGTPMTAWVVQPQGTGRAPLVVVIQEIFGLSDWIRGVADQLAAEGFIAVAPDLLSGQGPNGGDSRSIANQQEMMKATLSLPADLLTARLAAARAYGVKLPRSNGKSASIGFCFGGNQSFNMAVAEPMLNAAVVYYGSAPTDAPAGGGRGATAPFAPSDRLKTIQAPVLGLYGGLKEDARIGNTVAPTEAKMKELGKSYEPHVFEGAAHGFLRAQTGNNGANMKATQQAWPMTVAFLKKHTS
jgi:carboxymethylenebutenolidase